MEDNEGKNEVPLPNYISNCLDNLVKKIDKKYDSVNVTVVYDGMLTQVFRVTYTVTAVNIENNSENESDPEKQSILKSFIVKTIKADQSLQNEYDIIPAFIREFIFYQKIYPDLNQFQTSKAVKSVFHSGDFHIPKCYKIICNEAQGHYALILEDMTRSEYAPLEKDEPVNLEQATTVMQALGKFHAVSFAYKDQRPEDFLKYAELVDPLLERISNMEQLLIEFLNPRIDEAIEALQSHEEFRKEKLREFKENISQAIVSYMSQSHTDGCCVVGYGDSWVNNVLFKSVEDHVVGACFVDFQLCRYGSPILDLVYFIFASTSAELRNEHYSTLIRIYYENLSNTIKALGSDPNTIFSWHTFSQHLKRFGGYGLVMSMLQMESIVSENVKEKRMSIDEQLMKNDAKHRTPLIPVGIVEKLKKTERQERLAGIVRDIVRFGYI